MLATTEYQTTSTTYFYLMTLTVCYSSPLYLVHLSSETCVSPLRHLFFLLPLSLPISLVAPVEADAIHTPKKKKYEIDLQSWKDYNFFKLILHLSYCNQSCPCLHLTHVANCNPMDKQNSTRCKLCTSYYQYRSFVCVCACVYNYGS